GELSLDPAVARDITGVCDRYIEDLRDLLELARTVETVSGFGGFPSSAALELKFSLKGSGPAGIQAAIRTHIAEVLLMRQVCAQAIRNLVDVDEANATATAHIAE
ncbi:hypothetical protein, partial [Actinoplanes sp. GCM10030250]|uniref:hypothetical protein n=1 Tax=Actinoplanes sp. GCM10030250 TaxID=3273376 RepID=UPI0036078729